MNDILVLNPVFKETIWGGDKLKKQYGFDTPSDHIGENWCISAHPNGDCEIANGSFRGQKLSRVYASHRELFGYIPDENFPILVKWIDAKENLSVQIHPDDAYALTHENSRGKSECWYVIDCEPETKMVLGHHAKNRETLRRKIEQRDFDALLNVIDIQPGDFYWIPAGTIHAICKGTLIYEVQQSSDITYRLYDYDRLDQNGNKRPLHLEKSIAVAKVPYQMPILRPATKQLEDCTCVTYLDNEYFTVTRYEISARLRFSNDEPFRLVTVLAGTGSCNGEYIKAGMSFIITSAAKNVVYEGKLTLIETLLGRKK